jgi:hypothetical protein
MAFDVCLYLPAPDGSIPLLVSPLFSRVFIQPGLETRKETFMIHPIPNR